MTHRKIIIFLVYIFILGALVAFMIPGFIRQRLKPSFSEHEKRVMAENDSLRQVNQRYERQLAEISIKVDSLTSVVNNNKTKVIYLNNNRNEKMRIINSLSNDELYRYFTEFKAKGGSTR